MSSETNWEQRYREGSTGWDRGQANPALSHFLESWRAEPGRILIPGCGNGHEVELLIDAGFDVTAIDIAPTPLENLEARLRQRGRSATLVQTDLFHWEAGETFDVVYEQTCLCALPPSRWAAYEQCLHRWIRPGGCLFALFMQTHAEGGPPYHCAIDDMPALFGAERWQWPDHEPHRNMHHGGKYELGVCLTRL